MKIAMVSPSRESEKAISGYSVNLISAFKKNKCKIDEINYTAGAPTSLFKQLPKIKNYDIIHIQHEYNLLGWYGMPYFILFLILGLLKKGKLVVTMHTVLSKTEKFKGNALKNFLRKGLYFFQNKLINWASDSIILHSNFFVPILNKEYGIPRKKITVLPQGIITNIKKLNKQKVKKELKLSGPVYLIIGNLVPDHGAHLVIKQANKIGKTILIVANPQAVNDRKDKRLQDYLKFNKEYVKNHKFTKHVRFDIKQLSDKDPIWWKYFFASDLVLQPYMGGIGSGIFSHAISANIPVVASNIKFFEEISKNFGCVKIVKKNEDYAKVIKEAMKPKNYAKMKKECTRYFKENSWDNISKKYVKMYSVLLQK
jgi:glycosyltransferase involved in cell wall biosynthesis